MGFLGSEGVGRLTFIQSGAFREFHHFVSTNIGILLYSRPRHPVRSFPAHHSWVCLRVIDGALLMQSKARVP
jgi:hypothetical protein